jgi:hypothetical protein
MARFAKKAPKKLQETVQVKDWGEPHIDRLAVILIALEQMDARERSAVFGFLKSKFSEEWPRGEY